MIEGGEHHDSLEELFTLQNTEELKVIVRCKVFPSDFGFQRVDQTGSFFIFWIRASLYVCKHSLESLKRLACLSQYTQKGEKEFFKLLRDVINAFAYSNLTLVKGGAEGETGAFGKLCVPLKKYWLRPWEVYRSSGGQTYTHQG